MPVRRLTLEEAIAIHKRVIAEFGGIDGIADQGLLSSALSAPFAGFGNDDVYGSVPHKAAVLLFTLCKNHPFLDGNKRVAAAACEIFLLLNGFELDLNNDEFAELTISVADGSVSKDDLLAQMQTLAVPRP